MKKILNNTMINSFIDGKVVTFKNHDNIEDIVVTIPTNVYIIPLETYNISNDFTNAVATTKGINNALKYAVENNYDGAKLPPGHYALEVDSSQGTHMMHNSEYGWDWGHNQTGMVMRDNFVIDITDCTLEMIPSKESTHYSLVTFSGCNGATLIGGTLIGDRYTHDYGQIINDNGTELEVGGFDEETGLVIDDTTKLRTKDYITNYKGETLPSTFKIMPLQSTNFNTTDGGRCFVYCYDENNNFLGTCHGDGWGGYLADINLIESTAKIKVSFWNEHDLTAKFYISMLGNYASLEWGSGIVFTDAQNCIVKGTKIIDFIGDCVATNCPPTDYINYNLALLDCTLENSRRQGISLTGDSEVFIVKNCNIGYINGVDPQCGVDIETETGSARKVVFDNCHFYMNKRADFDNFNGVDTVIKNCTFNGSIATIYGYGLKLFNNTFEYKLLEPNPKNNHVVCRVAYASFNDDLNDCDDNICCKNTFIGDKARVTMPRGKNNYIYKNTVKDGAELVTRIDTYGNKFSNGSNAYYGYSLYGDSNEQQTYIIKNETFEDSKVNNLLQVEDSRMINSECAGSKYSVYKNCDIQGKKSSILGGDATYENCKIKVPADDFIKYGEFCNLKFKNCTIETKRKYFLYYGNLTFKNCHIKFMGGDESNTVNWINEGYENPKHVFADCIFESELPIKILKGTITNPTVIGNVQFI